MMTDPIADFLTRIRNALMVKHSLVKARDSKIFRKIAEILKINGYIKDVAYEGDGLEKIIVLKLKYDLNGVSIISGLKRISKPGLRIYKQSSELPVVLGGVGMAIISTSNGVLSTKEAKEKNIGGEVVCSIW